MTNEFFHSGATGDIIFSLPTIKAMGGGKLYITNFDKQRSESIKRLIEVQPYITEVEIRDGWCPGYDLNRFRDYASHNNNLVEAHFKGQNIPIDPTWKEGWLTLPESNYQLFPNIKYSVINRTNRYADPNFNWANEVEYLKSISDEVYFLGYEYECEEFNNKFGTNVEFIDLDFKQGAYFIKNAVMFSGCYSCWSTIAMGLGLTYRLEQAPGHTCSSLFEPRETIINV
jgi:hypothetical protein